METVHSLPCQQIQWLKRPIYRKSRRTFTALTNENFEHYNYLLVLSIFQLINAQYMLIVTKTNHGAYKYVLLSLILCVEKLTRRKSVIGISVQVSTHIVHTLSGWPQTWNTRGFL